MLRNTLTQKLIFLFSIFFSTLNAQEFFTENFEGTMGANGISAGWTETGLTTDGIYHVGTNLNASSAYVTFPSAIHEPIGYLKLEPDTLFCASVTGNNEIEANFTYVSMFPKPNNDIVNFVFDQDKIPNELLIKDGLGKTVYTTQVLQSNIQVELSNLCSGFNYISIDKTTNLRLLKN
jgi:hypothetical protein